MIKGEHMKGAKTMKRAGVVFGAAVAILNIRWFVMAASLAALPPWGNALVCRPEKGAMSFPAGK